jgi:hypothetical protein
MSAMVFWFLPIVGASVIAGGLTGAAVGAVAGAGVGYYYARRAYYPYPVFAYPYPPYPAYYGYPAPYPGRALPPAW